MKNTTRTSQESQIPTTPKTILRSDSTNPYPTTFVQADTSTFKQVVQMLTGSSETTKPQLQQQQQQQQDLVQPQSSSSKNFNIPPMKATPKKQQGFKLYERRNNNNNHHLKNTLMINSKQRETHQYIVSPVATNFLQIQSGTNFSRDSICSSTAPIGMRILVSYSLLITINKKPCML